jgi:hypothetical protein
MSIYNYDNEIVAEQLTPPVLRNPKMLGWLYTLTYAIQNKWSLIFEDYKTGSTYSDWNLLTTYSVKDRVIWTDKSIYECIKATLAGDAPYDAEYWVKVNDLFIGMDERIKYTSQKLIFELALNTFFKTTGIFITNNFVNANTNFVMGGSSSTSSVMPLNSINQIDYMGYSPYYLIYPYDYTINFPLADFTALGTATESDLIIKNFADKYNIHGMQYNIATF